MSHLDEPLRGGTGLDGSGAGIRAARRVIDLNADLGESFGPYRYGNDEELMPLITSANVACGFHAGDPHTMRLTVDLAHRHGVRIGAHMGLPDRLGFGRRTMEITGQEAYDYSLFQIAALGGFLRRDGIRMHHVKPHGALYMMASADAELADGIARAVADYDMGLLLYALPGSELALAGARRGLQVVEEFFADRPYVGRDVVMFGWSYEQIGSPQSAVERMRAMLHDPSFSSVGTVCVHSDTVDAPAIMAALRTSLENDPGIALNDGS
ncbi:5-oxoprolinase subunit PxpA [Herbiconiux sp. UC225_62]|uniref:5-oxoprolinase subunit PxpA n=1 Tax=Herbiconiux sp. UC225_62 TaxID=3350168 RepID=UPI0036D223C4